MNAFSHRLRSLATRLPIPEPARSRVLLEMASDMEDSFQYHVDRGADPDEAVRIVEEQFDLSDDALRELVQLHASPLQRSLDGITRQAQSPWERVILALVALFVAPMLVALLLKPGLLENASGLASVLLGILALALGMGAWQSRILFGKRSGQRGRRPSRGLRTLPLLAVTSMGLGFAGIWIELYRSALVIRDAPAMAMLHLVQWLRMASATMVIALSGALLTGLLWFFLESRAAHLEEKAAVSMLESTP